MWLNNNRSDITCRMTPESVCVKYSYYYNSAGKYIIYICFRIPIIPMIHIILDYITSVLKAC